MFRNRFDIFARFDADGTPQGGDAGEGGRDDDTARTVGFQKLLDRYGQDAMRLAESLHHENFQARQRARELEARVQDLQGQVPGEGAVVLTGDDAAAWAAYRELGAPDTLQTAVTERDELQGRLQGLEREAQIRAVAEAAGFKPSVLAKLEATARAEGRELAFEVRDVEQDGAIVKTPYVTDGETQTSLTEYAAQEWADFLPALAATPQGGEPVPGTPYPSQQPTGGGGRPETTKAVAERYISKTYRRPDNGSHGNSR
jgi:hypothetical protein